jgi:hypothetical protein
MCTSPHSNLRKAGGLELLPHHVRTVFPRLEEFDDLATEDGEFQLRTLDVRQGLDCESVHGGISSDHTGYLPVISAEPLVAENLVGIFQTVEDELVPAACFIVVRVPQIFFILAGVHPQKHVILCPHRLSPWAQPLDRQINGVIPKHRSERENAHRLLELWEPGHAVVKCPPKAETSDVLVLRRVL